MSKPRPVSAISSRYSPEKLTGRRVDNITKPMAHETLPDQTDVSDTRSPEELDLAKKKTQYYHHIFALREPVTSARQRLLKECIVTVDIRTNVIISDEYLFITSISQKFSELYQRPESSIVVSLIHTSCLLFGGSFDPAYIMTVSSIPAQLAPATNMQNALSIQGYMQETLHVLPERGLVKFEAIPEANLATNGKTVLGEMEDLAKKIEANHANLRTYLGVTPDMKLRRSTRSTRSLKIGPTLPTHHEQMTSPSLSSWEVISADGEEGAPPPPTIVKWKDNIDEKSDVDVKLSRRKSFSAWMLGKGGRHT